MPRYHRSVFQRKGPDAVPIPVCKKAEAAAGPFLTGPIPIAQIPTPGLSTVKFTVTIRPTLSNLATGTPLPITNDTTSAWAPTTATNNTTTTHTLTCNSDEDVHYFGLKRLAFTPEGFKYFSISDLFAQLAKP